MYGSRCVLDLCWQVHVDSWVVGVEHALVTPWIMRGVLSCVHSCSRICSEVGAPAPALAVTHGTMMLSTCALSNCKLQDHVSCSMRLCTCIYVDEHCMEGKVLGL